GCGQAFDVPEGYGRNKIQCPGCGVICPVPEGGGSPGPARRARPAAAPARDVEAEAAAALAGPARGQAPAPPAAIPVATPAADPWGQPAVPVAHDGLLPPEEGERGDPEPVRRRAPEEWFHCRRCKRKVRRQGECPICDAAPQPELGMEPA